MSYAAENRDWLEPYVRQIADAIGLRDWEIELSDSDPQYGDAGACRIPYGQKRMTVMIAEHKSLDDLRNTVVHECLHCHIEPIHWAANNAQYHMGASAWQSFDNSMVDMIELAVDGIATALARLLPLPEVPA